MKSKSSSKAKAKSKVKAKAKPKTKAKAKPQKKTKAVKAPKPKAKTPKIAPPAPSEMPAMTPEHEPMIPDDLDDEPAPMAGADETESDLDEAV